MKFIQTYDKPIEGQNLLLKQERVFALKTSKAL